MFGAVDLAGAGQRLLPEDVPLRFFGAAAVFHILAWLGLLLTAADVPTFIGGGGPVLAAVHTLTLGVLVMTAFGASFQMLPVALGYGSPPAWLCNVAFAVLVAGAVLLIVGFALYEPVLIEAGAAAAAAAVALYAVIVARLLRGATEIRTVVLYVWVAIASIVAAAGLAVAMAFDITFDLLARRDHIAAAHLILAGYGFMGMLALGLSQVVVPLFAVGLVPYERWARQSLWLAVAAIVVAVAGLLLTASLLVAAGIVLALAAAGLHVRMMTDVVAKRLRNRLSAEFVLIRASWLMMPLPLAIGAGMAADVLPATAPALFAFSLLYGWLLTLLTGVLQRIVPLLASMHTGRLGRAPVVPTRLTADRPLLIHRYCHLVALAAVFAGIAADVAILVQAGAVVGLVGAVAFATFMAVVVRRTRAYIRTPAAGAPRAVSVAAESMQGH